VSKHQIRGEALRARRNLPHDEVISLSSQAAENLTCLPEFRDARVIASYVAKGDEVQTEDIIREALVKGKKVLVPRTNPKNLSLSFSEIKDLSGLREGPYGILEPPSGSESVPLSESDLILVPVVAWDSKGNRVGYGKGYFDRELKSRGKALAIGLAFELQRHDIIPTSLEDVPLDLLVTEKRVLRFRRGIS
jgi:5-formyltetrahydrofolate cyclo-ligase